MRRLLLCYNSSLRHQRRQVVNLLGVMSVQTCLPACPDRNLGPTGHSLLERVTTFLTIRRPLLFAQCVQVAFDQILNVCNAVIDRFTPIHSHRMSSVSDQSRPAVQVLPSASIGSQPVFEFDLLQWGVGGYAAYGVLERGCPVTCNLLDQRQSCFLGFWYLGGMVTAKEAFAIPPTDIDLAPELLSFVDGRRLLYAEKQETAVRVVTLEEERVELAHPDDDV
jgi:hypothetical protein